MGTLDALGLDSRGLGRAPEGFRMEEQPEAVMEVPPRLHFVGWRRGGKYSRQSKSL